MTAERSEEDKEQEQKEYIKKNSSVWTIYSIWLHKIAHTDHNPNLCNLQRELVSEFVVSETESDSNMREKEDTKRFSSARTMV